MALWRERAIRMLLLSRNVSRFGDRFTAVAVAAVAVRIAHAAPTVVTLVFAVMLLPPVLVGWWSGAFVDRFPRRSLMIVSDVSRVVLVLMLVFAHQLPWLLLLLLVIGIAGSFYTPAYASLLPQAAGERLLAANALSQTIATVVDVGGYALAGLVVALWPLPLAFVVDAATFAASAAFLWRLDLEPSRAPARFSLRALLGDVQEGWRVVQASRDGRTLLWQMAWACLGIGAVNGLLVLLLTRTLHAPMGMYGVMLAVQGLAMAAMGTWLPGLGRRTTPQRMIRAGLALTGVVIVGMSLAPSVIVLALLYAALGATNMAFLVPLLTLYQQSFDDRHRGRAQSLYTVVVNAALVVSTLAAGDVAAAIGVPMTVAVGGLLLMMAAAIRLRMAHKPPDVRLSSSL